LMLEGVVLPAGDAKITLVLHGPVLRSLLRDSYRQNKDLVDQAASLSAMEVIDVKACNTWMTSNGVNSEDLQPFVETVIYGPAEVTRLLNDTRYLNF
jgi:intracellular sulfur oxidation DsrE/DsrF family protein